MSFPDHIITWTFEIWIDFAKSASGITLPIYTPAPAYKDACCLVPGQEMLSKEILTTPMGENGL